MLKNEIAIFMLRFGFSVWETERQGEGSEIADEKDTLPH